MMSARPTLVSLTVVALLRAASADPLHDAERLYRDGQTAFDLGHYDDALTMWQRSYELSHLPALHYNLGQAYRLRAHLGDCAHAREEYQAFLQDAESSPQRTLADQYVAQLATCAASPPLTSSPTVQPQIETLPVVAPPLANRRLAAAAVGAGGVVLFAGGLYLGAHARTLGNEVASACAPPTGCSWTAEQSRDAAGRRDATVGYTFDALGVAAIVGGAAYYWFGVHAYEVPPVAIQTRAGGGVLSWRRAW
jgi:tetratricopeptide (TPR) repeat protein